jgi:hypothetical protein
MSPRRRASRVEGVRGAFGTGLVLTLWLMSAGTAAGEVSLGLTGGMVFGAAQDVTVKTYAPGGTLDSVAVGEGVSVNPGGIGGLTLGYWLDPASPFGVHAEALYWANSLSTRGETRQFHVDETRAGLFLTLLGRYLLEGPGSSYFFGGLGAGLVYTRLSPGGDDIGPGFQALVGLAVTATPRVRFRLEVRYLVAPDAEPSRRRSNVAQTSGGGATNPARKVFGGSFDTQFIPVTIGLDWVF